jgi:hypothetical protein
LARTEDLTVAKDEIDPEDLELEIDLEGEEDLDILDEDLEEDDSLLDDDATDEDVDDDDSLGTTIVRKAGDEDDDEDDMLAPDDVEEDLAEILKDRMASEEIPAEEDEVAETDERGSSDEALQPKRADEILCSSCFLLVRQSAPTCPVGDDACPVFVR